MRKFSSVAAMLGCMALLSPRLASADVILPSLSFDDVTESPTAAVTGFNNFSATFNNSSGSEIISYSGAIAATPLNHFQGAEAFVVLLDPQTNAVSDILDIIFTQGRNASLITVSGTFTSDGELGPTLIAPEGAPTLVETGDWQDVSTLIQQQLAAQNFSGGNITVLLRSDVETNVIPEPASMIVWSLIACGIAAPGLRRRWRTAAKAA